MKIGKLAAAGLIILGLYSINAYSVSLNLDTEYRIRGLAYSNLDYLESTADRSNYYSHRMRICLASKPVENLELITRVQAVGIAEGTTTYIRYPDENFKPFVENIYFKLNNIFDIPLGLSIGKQPFWYGQGIIVSDDEMGYTGLKIKYTYPWKNISSEIFTAKSSESMGTAGDYDLYGLVNTIPGRVNTWQLSVFYENNRSSCVYVGNDLASIDRKYFFDVFLDGRMEEGAYYNLEVVMQKGKVDKVDSNLIDPTYNSLAYIFNGGYFGYNDKFGRIELNFTYGLGEGDNNGYDDKIETFSPGFGHKYDGLERTGYGDFFAATLYDVYHGLNDGYSGLQIISLGGSIAPIAKSTIGIDYSLFKADEAPPGGDKDLGAELDFKGSFIYNKYLDFAASIALFFPGGGTMAVGSKATRLMLESNIKF